MPTVIPTSNKIEPQKGKMFPPESTIAKIYMPVAPMIHKNAHTDSIRHINFAFVARIPFVNTSDTHVAIDRSQSSQLYLPASMSGTGLGCPSTKKTAYRQTL